MKHPLFNIILTTFNNKPKKQLTQLIIALNCLIDWYFCSFAHNCLFGTNYQYLFFLSCFTLCGVTSFPFGSIIVVFSIVPFICVRKDLMYSFLNLSCSTFSAEVNVPAFSF